ncbi:MAG: hypothetical protein ACLQT7_04300 [Candidatus Dormibacteria bacterium]
MLRNLTVAALLLTATACGGTSAHSSPTPRVSHTASASPTPSPSAAPDNEQVTVVGSGVGTFDLQAYPIAIVSNLAAAHIATGVVVSFTVRISGGSYTLAAEPVSLAPGETLAVTVLCTDSCQRATAATAAVTVGGWTAGTRTVISGTTATYTCGDPCYGSGGGYQGSAVGSVSGQVPAGTLITVTAVCRNGGGDVVGGGSTTTLWPEAASAAATVTVLTTSEPATCQLYGTEVS